MPTPPKNTYELLDRLHALIGPLRKELGLPT